MAQSLLQAVSPNTTTVFVSFSGAVNGATTAGNWTLSTGSVSSVSAIGTDQKMFRLTVSGLTAGIQYTITTGASIVDTSGGALNNKSATFYADRGFSNNVSIDAISGKKQPRNRKGSSGQPPSPVPVTGSVGWPVG